MEDKKELKEGGGIKKEGNMNAKERRKERRKQISKEIGLKKRNDSLLQRFRESDDATRAKILGLGIIERKIGQEEIRQFMDKGKKYNYPLCGYAVSRWEIDGKKYGVCALADFIESPRVCEFEFPMLPLKDCARYQMFQRQNGARPTKMYIIRDNLNFLRLYFKWRRDEVVARVYMNRGSFGSRLNHISIEGICTDAKVSDGIIKESVRKITPKELSGIKSLVWGSYDDFPRRLHEELGYVLPKEDYENLKVPRGLKNKVKYEL